MQLQEETLSKKFRLFRESKPDLCNAAAALWPKDKLCRPNLEFSFFTDSTFDVMQGQWRDGFGYASEKYLSSFCNFRK